MSLKFLRSGACQRALRLALLGALVGGACLATYRWLPVMRGQVVRPASVQVVAATETPSNQQAGKAQQQTGVSANPAPYIAYLHEGDLWAMRSDGTDLRQLAVAPPGEVIQDFLWSADGTRCYFSVGLRFFDVSLETGNLASGGALALPETVSIDRLELARDGRSLIAHTLDELGSSGVYAVMLGEREARPLGVDEYHALTQARSPLVRQVGDLSVSPDARYVLFKEAVGTGEELFVAEVETGHRWQLSSLRDLSGFEASAEATGGRLIIEATWSPDGRYVMFNPAQSCSDTGLCYGRVYLVDAWGGALRQLSLEMTVTLPSEWSQDLTLLAYDDGSEIVLTDAQGQGRRLADGSRPKWQPQIIIANSR